MSEPEVVGDPHAVPRPTARSGAPGGELRASEERFRLLVDSVVDYAIFLLHPDGVIATWNPGAERLKGYRADEAIGSHYSRFYPAELRDAGLPDQLLDRARREGRVEHTGWRVRKDGTRFWADVVITALYDDTGEHTGFAKVTRDRTDAHEAEETREKALEEQQRLVSVLEELDRWRRDFISSVVHDLQTPVAAIGGFLSLLSSGDVPPTEREAVLGAMLTNTSSLQELIDNLRAYTALSEPRNQLDPEPVLLSGFVTELVAATAPLLGDREVTVDVADVTVDADRHGLERVLRNLLTNAARHTPSDANVTVRARRDAERVVIEVEDDGDGIDPGLLPRVFDRFEHGGGGGTGLGLSIAKRYVELHGGSIEVENEPGAGALFRVSLPLA